MNEKTNCYYITFYMNNGCIIKVNPETCRISKEHAVLCIWQKDKAKSESDMLTLSLASDMLTLSSANVSFSIVTRKPWPYDYKAIKDEKLRDSYKYWVIK